MYLPQSIPAAIAEMPKTQDLESGKSKIKVRRADWDLVEAHFPTGRQPSSPWVLTGQKGWDLHELFPKGTDPIHEGSTLMNESHSKGPAPEHHHMWWGFHIWTLRDKLSVPSRIPGYLAASLFASRYAFRIPGITFDKTLKLICKLVKRNVIKSPWFLTYGHLNGKTQRTNFLTAE